MKTTYISNATSIILFFDGSPVKVEKTDTRYPEIIKALSLEDDGEQYDALQAILNPPPPIEKAKEVLKNDTEFQIIDDEVYFEGEKLPKALSDKVVSIIRDGLPVEHFVNFWKNLLNNPSKTSIDELIDFLEYKELPITSDGCFLAYKGLRDDYFSVHGNTSTKVLQGTVDASGHIFNGIGEVIEVRRNQVCDNRDHHCSYGLHVGSLNYAQGFAGKLVVVKVNPADVVSVPNDCNCQKCRVCKYEVVADFKAEIKSSVTDEDGDGLAPDAMVERKEFVNKVDRYLSNKANNGIEEVTIRQIQCSFSPEWPSKLEILDALQELGYYWEEREGTVFVEL